jgi:hypothetical protein
MCIRCDYRDAPAAALKLNLPGYIGSQMVPATLRDRGIVGFSTLTTRSAAAATLR